MTKLRETGATTGIGVLATYSYTPTGQRAAVTFGNGTSRSYAYDTAGRTTGVKLDLAGAEHDLVIGAVASSGAGTGTPVSYNPAGQIVSRSRRPFDRLRAIGPQQPGPRTACLSATMRSTGSTNTPARAG